MGGDWRLEAFKNQMLERDPVTCTRMGTALRSYSALFPPCRSPYIVRSIFLFLAPPDLGLAANWLEIHARSLEGRETRKGTYSVVNLRRAQKDDPDEIWLCRERGLFPLLALLLCLFASCCRPFSHLLSCFSLSLFSLSPYSPSPALSLPRTTSHNRQPNLSRGLSRSGQALPSSLPPFLPPFLPLSLPLPPLSNMQTGADGFDLEGRSEWAERNRRARVLRLAMLFVMFLLLSEDPQGMDNPNNVGKKKRAEREKQQLLDEPGKDAFGERSKLNRRIERAQAGHHRMEALSDEAEALANNGTGGKTAGENADENADENGGGLPGAEEVWPHYPHNVTGYYRGDWNEIPAADWSLDPDRFPVLSPPAESAESDGGKSSRSILTVPQGLGVFVLWPDVDVDKLVDLQGKPLALDSKLAEEVAKKAAGAASPSATPSATPAASPASPSPLPPRPLKSSLASSSGALTLHLTMKHITGISSFSLLRGLLKQTDGDYPTSRDALIFVRGVVAHDTGRVHLVGGGDGEQKAIVTIGEEGAAEGAAEASGKGRRRELGERGEYKPPPEESANSVASSKADEAAAEATVDVTTSSASTSAASTSASPIHPTLASSLSHFLSSSSDDDVPKDDLSAELLSLLSSHGDGGSGWSPFFSSSQPTDEDLQLLRSLAEPEGAKDEKIPAAAAANATATAPATPVSPASPDNSTSPPSSASSSIAALPLSLFPFPSTTVITPMEKQYLVNTGGCLYEVSPCT